MVVDEVDVDVVGVERNVFGGVLHHFSLRGTPFGAVVRIGRHLWCDHLVSITDDSGDSGGYLRVIVLSS